MKIKYFCEILNKVFFAARYIIRNIMYFFIIAVFTVISLTATGCGIEDIDILAYQQNLSGAEILIDRTYGANVRFEGDKTSIVLTAPAEISDISFMIDITGGVFSASVGDMSIPISGEAVRGLMPITGAFSLNSENMGKIYSEKNGIAVAEFSDDSGVYKVYLDSKSDKNHPIPVKIEADAFGRDLTIEIKSLQYN